MSWILLIIFESERKNCLSNVCGADIVRCAYALGYVGVIMGNKFAALHAGRSKQPQGTYLRAFGIALSKGMLADVIAFFDILLVVISAFIIKVVYVDLYADDYGGEFRNNYVNYLTAIALIAAALYLTLMKRRHYNEENIDCTSIKKSFFTLSYTVIFSFGFGSFVIFLFKQGGEFSRVWLLSWCTSTFAILFLSRVFWSHQIRSMVSRGYLKRSVYLLGTGEALRNARKCLTAPGTDVSLSGIGDVGTAAKPLFKPIGAAVAKCQSGELDEIVIALPPEDRRLAEEIVRRLRLLPIDIKLALDYYNCPLKLLDVCDVGGASLASVRRKPISGWNVVLKMIEDYVLATLGIIVFLPAMVVIALAIKLDSKGPVIFRQRRHGWNHKIIEVWKFRTMTVQENGSKVVQATRNDKRVTKVGRFLRRTSLDELPQLFNVLRGDMSLVGPRPHAVAHNDHYSKTLQDYACRHRVKPGITGWAQINGFRGETSEPGQMMQRVRYDLEYIENWSIGFDLEILFMTPLYGFISKQAY